MRPLDAASYGVDEISITEDFEGRYAISAPRPPFFAGSRPVNRIVDQPTVKWRIGDAWCLAVVAAKFTSRGEVDRAAMDADLRQMIATSKS